jgi:hypothetical protein
MFLATALGVVLSGGRSILLSSVVDLDTGNLLWMHFDQSITKDLKDYASAIDMVSGIMNQYPDGK